MTEDELAELMSEPPGGEQHGRKRVAGRWVDLGQEEIHDSGYHAQPRRYAKRRSVKPADTIRHGTLSAYTNDRCRCEPCKVAMRDWKRGRRRV